jgi:hypothetical protein
MGSHPANLVVRFILELTALFSMGLWAWKQHDGFLRFILAIGIPVIAAAIWGIFAVPNDPSRSGSVPVPVPGIVRLVFELAFFAFAAWALLDAGYNRISLVFLIVAIIHYCLSYDRISWLVKQ